jgi:hypothetical protein
LLTRRNFIRNASLGGAALMALGAGESPWPGLAASPSALYTLSNDLVQRWGEKLLQLQVTDKANTQYYGGILCPTYKIVHGRSGDTIYPFFFLADKYKDNRYIDAAVLLFQWMETHVSQDDGSWLNEPVRGSWKGTTVFSSIALAETMLHYGNIMDASFKQRIEDRLRLAGNYIYQNFNLDYGNINYPIAASYGLTLLGEVLDIARFKTRGKEFAHQALSFITPTDHLIFGEGTPYYQRSPKGCLSVDLGYNVEESLPSLVSYGLFTRDEEVLGHVTTALQSHMEFMLPDGGWDNSWGTRNYKWTYWGSRTSDGCQPAYALMTDRDPRFYKVALRNTQLLEQCTKDGLLYGGPHYISHGVPPSVHHTFCHIKALVPLAMRDVWRDRAETQAILPREKPYGVNFFQDIQTWLVAKGKFRATVTGYDREYKKTTQGHASGGALTMLWHEQAGILLCASMNVYQLIEAGNMQPDPDPLSMPLTPRIELRIGDVVYMNINDLSAQVHLKQDETRIILETTSSLVDKDQNSPPKGAVPCFVKYIFEDNAITIHYRYDNALYGDAIQALVPIISPATDVLQKISDTILRIRKSKSTVTFTSSNKIDYLPTTGSRLFNFVPGLEAVPVRLSGSENTLTINIAQS